MGNSISTLIGWAIVLGLAGLCSLHGWKKNATAQQIRADTQRLRSRPNPIQPKKPSENKTKRKRNHVAKQQKAQKAQTEVPVQTTSPKESHDSDGDDGIDNREFARQLSTVKQGTTFTAKAKDESRQKSIKQSRARALSLPHDDTPTSNPSAPSSTAGIDADDDRTSAASPTLEPTGSGNVEDMLEKPAPGPSVLRLTVSENKPIPFKAAKKPKAAPEPKETKKQRQNRRKAELAKVARQEAEQDRKVKEEAQRRKARLAEGRAAKDGSAFMAAQANGKANAWTTNGANGVNGVNGVSAPNGVNGKAETAKPKTNGFVPVQPLDTFDTNNAPAGASKSTKASATKTEDWLTSLPSEEEQMEMIRREHQDDGWSTVKKKSRKAQKQAQTGDNTTKVEKSTTDSLAEESSASTTASAPIKKRIVATVSSASAAGSFSVLNANGDDLNEWVL